MRFWISLRLAGLITGALFGYALLPRQVVGYESPSFGVNLLWMGAWTVIGFSLLPYLAVVPTRAVRREISSLSAGQLVVATAGGLIGMVAGLILGFPLQGLPGDAGIFLALSASLVFGIGLSGVALVRSSDLLRLFGWPAPSTPGKASSAEGGLVLDTSALIDGRIIDVIRMGLTAERIVISRATIDELRMLTDDPARHAKGLRGSSMIVALRGIPRVHLEVVADNTTDGRDADARILTLAATRGATLVTTDAALERAAVGAGVAVTNMHALADALLSVVSPGDVLRVVLEERGREPGQAVGHLRDGTLIIVEGAVELVGRGEIEVLVARLIRTGGGRIVFARPNSLGH